MAKVHDLGDLRGGETFEITLRGTESDVFLVDESNYRSYRSGRRFEYFGGHFKRSPVILSVPNSGKWFLVVDSQRVEYSIRQLR